MSRRRRPDPHNLRELRAAIADGTDITPEVWKSALAGLSELSVKQRKFIETVFTLRDRLQRAPTQVEIAAELGVSQKSVSTMVNRVHSNLPGLLLIVGTRASTVNET